MRTHFHWSRFFEVITKLTMHRSWFLVHTVSRSAVTQKEFTNSPCVTRVYRTVTSRMSWAWLTATATSITDAVTSIVPPVTSGLAALTKLDHRYSEDTDVQAHREGQSQQGSLAQGGGAPCYTTTATFKLSSDAYAPAPCGQGWHGRASVWRALVDRLADDDATFTTTRESVLECITRKKGPPLPPRHEEEDAATPSLDASDDGAGGQDDKLLLLHAALLAADPMVPTDALQCMLRRFGVSTVVPEAEDPHVLSAVMQLPGMQDRHRRLTPRRVSDAAFWTNFLWRRELLRLSSDLAGAIRMHAVLLAVTTNDDDDDDGGGRQAHSVAAFRDPLLQAQAACEAVEQRQRAMADAVSSAMAAHNLLESLLSSTDVGGPATNAAPSSPSRELLHSVAESCIYHKNRMATLLAPPSSPNQADPSAVLFAKASDPTTADPDDANATSPWAADIREVADVNEALRRVLARYHGIVVSSAAASGGEDDDVAPSAVPSVEASLEATGQCRHEEGGDSPASDASLTYRGAVGASPPTTTMPAAGKCRREGGSDSESGNPMRDDRETSLDGGEVFEARMPWDEE